MAPMREECKNFQSRTYSSGEVARFCELDLAPEAPWRCPAGCASFEPRTADAGWDQGSLVRPEVEVEPELPGGTGSEIAAMLADADSVVAAIAPDALREARERDALAAREEQRRRRGSQAREVLRRLRRGR